MFYSIPCILKQKLQIYETMRDYTENKNCKKMYAVLEIIRYDHLVDKGVAKGGRVGPAHPRMKPKHFTSAII
jgi:hypothetical protein